MTHAHHRRAPRLDHLLLAQRHPAEVARLIVLLRGAANEPTAGLRHLHVEHERDGTCCALEPWSSTMRAMLTESMSEVQT
jgi:hypothetical protein